MLGSLGHSYEVSENSQSLLSLDVILEKHNSLTCLDVILNKKILLIGLW
jgi:hypothetical protein